MDTKQLVYQMSQSLARICNEILNWRKYDAEIDSRNWANCLKTSIFDIEIHCVAFDWSNGHIGVAFDQTSSLNTENLSELVFYSIKQGISSRPCAGSPQSSFIILFNNIRYHTVTDSIQFNKFKNFAFNVLEVSGRVECSWSQRFMSNEEYFQPILN